MNTPFYEAYYLGDVSPYGEVSFCDGHHSDPEGCERALELHRRIRMLRKHTPRRPVIVHMRAYHPEGAPGELGATPPLPLDGPLPEKPVWMAAEINRAHGTVWPAGPVYPTRGAVEAAVPRGLTPAAVVEVTLRKPTGTGGPLDEDAIRTLNDITKSIPAP